MRWEVRQLQKQPTYGLRSVTYVGAPRMAVDAATGEAKALPWTTGADGDGAHDGAHDGGRSGRMSHVDATALPVVVEARLSGPPASAYESGSGLRVRLLLDPYYPFTPPEVRTPRPPRSSTRRLAHRRMG